MSARQGKRRPGVILYFDIRPCLKRLNIEEKGKLFEAILNFAELGIIPEFDGVLGVAWDFIQPKIERDEERYKDISEKRTRAILKRWEKEKASALDTNVYNCTDEATTPPTTADDEPKENKLLFGDIPDFEELKRQRLAELQGGK